MFQKGSGVENKDLYSDLLKKRKKEERKKNLMHGKIVELYYLSARYEVIF